MCRISIVFMLAISIPLNAQQTQPAKDKIQIVKMTVYPAAETKPALKIQFLPPILEQTRGNAALLYSTACQLLSAVENKRDLSRKMGDWLKLPVDEIPGYEKNFHTRHYTEKIPELRNSGLIKSKHYAEMAARRDSCDWERPLSEGIVLQIPELGLMRTLSKYIALEARLAIANGDINTGIHDLQTGFAVSRHAADGSTIIADLVGISICAMMLKEVEGLILAKGAENYYWALASLPNPFIDIRWSIEQESVLLYRTYPFLADIETKPPTEEQYHKFMNEMERLTADIKETSTKPVRDKTAREAIIKEEYPKAKKYLIEHGKTPQQVERMTALQVVMLYHVRTYEQMRDDMFKWVNVPSWQARERGRLDEQQFDKVCKKMKNNKLFAFLPSTAKFCETSTDLNRKIAMLKCVEAIRMYAAGHDGRLPATLGEIREVPVPVDPFSNSAFGFFVKDDVAALESLPPFGQGVRYEIRIRK